VLVLRFALLFFYFFPFAQNSAAEIMKFAVAATGLASFAVTQAQTCQEAITTAITPIGQAGLFGTSIAGLCNDPNTDLKASLEVALSNCPAGSDATLKSLVKVLAKIVCEQDGDTYELVFCLRIFLNAC